MSAAPPVDPRTWIEALLTPMWAALDPERAVRSALERRGRQVLAAGTSWPLPFSSGATAPLQVVAVGKAAAAMVRGASAALEHPLCGLLVAPSTEEGGDVSGLVRIAGQHPVPGPGSELAGRAVLQELDRPRRPGDWVLFLISGGGSALIEAPLAPLDLDDLAAVHRLLVGSGADITEMNAVRKHLSAVKGGRLALAAAPARCLTLLVSDVPEGREDVIASGPTLPDPARVDEVREIVERRGLVDALPRAVRSFLDAMPETPKPGDAAFEGSRHVVVLDNAVGRRALVAELGRRGIDAVEDMSCDDLPLGEALDRLLARLESRAADRGRPVAVVSGGELSCPVTGDGVGGRNLHFALCAAQRIAGSGAHTVVASVGTDGVDGNSRAAGAAVDGGSWAAAIAAGWDPGAELERSNSFAVLDGLGAALHTGPTGTNVRDVRILVRWPG